MYSDIFISNSHGQVGATPVHSPSSPHTLSPPLLGVRIYPEVQVYVARLAKVAPEVVTSPLSGLVRGGQVTTVRRT